MEMLRDRGKLRIVNNDPALGMYEIPYSEISGLFDLEDRTIGSWTMWITSKDRPHVFRINSRWFNETNGSWQKEPLGEFDATRFFIPRHSSITTLGNLLSELHMDHFYIMHLSYEGKEKERLWKYARKNSLIGLSNSLVTNHWLKVENQVRSRLQRVWIHQFDLFCKDMELGDIVLVLNGCTRLLGVAQTRENDARFSSRFSNSFFDHVRYIDWIITYDFDKADLLPHRLDGFSNTLCRVDKDKRYWKELTSVNIDTAQRGHTTRTQGSKQDKKSQVLRARKHDIGIESSDHKELKEWIADNPQAIGLYDVKDSKMEYVFPSGDRVDVVFELKNDRYAVVEIETWDAFPGCYQALKYRTLKCAELGLPVTSSRIQAKVVAWGFEPFVKAFCSQYRIATYEKKLPIKSNP
jgi:hypothetical protein